MDDAIEEADEVDEEDIPLDELDCVDEDAGPRQKIECAFPLESKFSLQN